MAVVALIIYAFYKTCLSGPARQPGDDGDDRPHGGRGGYSGGSGGPGSPPPPGFRDDYMPGGAYVMQQIIIISFHQSWVNSTPEFDFLSNSISGFGI